MATVTQVLNLERAEIGTPETPTNRQKYGVWYGWNGVAWCAMFQSWVLAQFPGMLEACGGRHASASGWAKWFRDNGRWSEHPQPGALVFYDWPDNEHGVQHVGMVEAVLENGYIQAIEGNTRPGAHGGEGVWRRIRSPRFVVGYGLPHYDTVPVPSRVKPAQRAHLVKRATRRKPKAPAFPLPKGWYFGPRIPLKNERSVSGYFGHRQSLRLFQRRLKQLGHPVRITGRYDDSGTAQAVRAFQREHGLQVDGLIDRETWLAAWK